MSLNPENRIKTFRSIRTRLILGYTTVLLVSIFFLGAYFFMQLRENVSQAAKEFLKSEFDVTVELLHSGNRDLENLSNFLSQRTLTHQGPYLLSYALFNQEGLVIAKSESFAEDASSLTKLNSLNMKTNQAICESKIRNSKGDTFFVITGKFSDARGETFYLQLALQRASTVKTLGPIPKTVLWILPLVLLVAISGGFFLTTRVLAPIAKLTRAAQGLSDTDSGQLLPIVGTGDELDLLAQTFNEVFEKKQRAYQRIVRFTADASHELRLPITAIKGEAEIILERERSLDEYQKILASIIEEMNRLTAMIGNLLTLTRTDSGADVLRKENVHINTLLMDLIDFYEPLYAEKDIHVSLDTANDFYTEGDPEKLQTVFSNLLENALKYTPQNGSIRFRILQEQNDCRIDVCDTGIGIAATELEKIFERFYRVDKSRARSEGGFGLGLSIAEAIVKVHQGRITVSSSPGKGSCFSVFLPVSHR